MWASATAGASPEFVCPLGHVTLLKSVQLNNGSATSAHVRVILRVPSRQLALIVGAIDLGSGATVTWTNWIALNPDDRLYLDTNQGLVNAWVSGAVLVGDPQVPSAESALPPSLPPQLGSLPASRPARQEP